MLDRFKDKPTEQTDAELFAFLEHHNNDNSSTNANANANTNTNAPNPNTTTSDKELNQPLYHEAEAEQFSPVSLEHEGAPATQNTNNHNAGAAISDPTTSRKSLDELHESSALEKFHKAYAENG